MTTTKATFPLFSFATKVSPQLHKEQDIWMCAFPADGKSRLLTRSTARVAYKPVLILRTISSSQALVAVVQRNDSSSKNPISISNIRVISTSKLHKKVSSIPKREFIKIKNTILGYLA